MTNKRVRTEETIRKHSELMKKKWAEDKEWAEWRREQLRKMTANQIENHRLREEAKERIEERWADEEWAEMMKKKQSEGAKARWSDPVKRAELLEKRRIAREAKKKLKEEQETGE